MTIENMSQAGQKLQKKNVRSIIFVHGTFVGEDPLGINWRLEQNDVPSWITTQFNKSTKGAVDAIFKDLGNFTNDYLDKFKREINESVESINEIECSIYPWDGQNNHIGRLKAVPDLVQKIAATKGNRVLLIGHSHAGQVFALITLFLEQKETAEMLFDGLKEIFPKTEKLESFKQNLAKIRKIHLDIVTLGAPIRYPWGCYENYQLLNIVNHRSDIYIDGVLNTRDGDYVQHWGINGTDITIPDKYHDLLAKLDVVIGKGSLDQEALDVIRSEHKRRIQRNSRGDEVGINIFVDYDDQGGRIFSNPLISWINRPNLIKSCLGHGAYTLEENKFRNTKLIIENLYRN